MLGFIKKEKQGIPMKYVKSVMLYLMIFFATFAASGEAYVYYIHNAVNDCDYYFECPISSPELKLQYANELEKLGAELGLYIYAVDYKPSSSNSSEYDIYVINDDTEEYIRRELKNEEGESISSVFSGRLYIQFRDISEINNRVDISLYNVIGEKEAVEVLRSKTIDKYGTGKPYEGGYAGDHYIILFTAWGLCYTIIALMSLIESIFIKKELCLKYIYGHSIRKLKWSVITEKVVTISIAALVGTYFANYFTEATAFGICMLIAVVGAILISCIVFVLSMHATDVRKIFGNILYGDKGQRCISIALLSITVILFVMSFALCMQNAVSSSKTVNQESFWNKYRDYESITFFSKVESDYANHKLDNEYATRFYEKYLDEYDISLAFNVAENGGMSEVSISEDYNVVYMNLNGANKLNLPLEVEKLPEEAFYVVLQSNMVNNLKTDKVGNDLAHLMDMLCVENSKRDIKVIPVKKHFEIQLIDIKNDDLSDNYVKDPVVIVDTHKKISEEFAANVCTAIMRFDKETDFEEFIHDIGYDDQVWYNENVFELYKEKKDESIMTLSINIGIAIIISMLFLVVLYAVLKIEFRYRAEEISIRKMLGESLSKRYAFIVRIINIDILVTAVATLIANSILHMMSPIYIILTIILVYALICTIFMMFAKVYESHNIPKTLKGGYMTW